MARMIDTEGKPMPNCADNSHFNLTLYPDGAMGMQAPAYSTVTGKYIAQTRCLEVSLRDIFDEFLANKNYLINCPGEPIAVAEMIREYATKFQTMAELVASTEPPQPPSCEDFFNLKMAGWASLKQRNKG